MPIERKKADRTFIYHSTIAIFISFDMIRNSETAHMAKSRSIDTPEVSPPNRKIW